MRVHELGFLYAVHGAGSGAAEYAGGGGESRGAVCTDEGGGGLGSCTHKGSVVENVSKPGWKASEGEWSGQRSASTVAPPLRSADKQAAFKAAVRSVQYAEGSQPVST